MVVEVYRCGSSCGLCALLNPCKLIVNTESAFLQQDVSLGHEMATNLTVKVISLIRHTRETGEDLCENEQESWFPLTRATT